MAIQPMDRIDICAMKRDRKAILELLQRRGIVEVSEIPEAEPTREAQEKPVFQRVDTAASREIFKKSLSTVRDAKSILDKMVPPKGEGFAFLKGRQAVTPDMVSRFYEKSTAILNDAYRIVRLHQEATESKAEIARAEALLETLRPWADLPVAFSFQGTKHTAAFIGTLDGEKSEESILLALSEADPTLSSVHVEIVWQSKVITCLYVIVLKNDAQRAENALRTIGFSRPSSGGTEPPAAQMERLQANKQAAATRIEKAKQGIASYASRRDDFKFLEDHLSMRIEKYEVIERLAQSRHVFSLSGYVPSAAAPALQAELLSSFDCTAETEGAGEPGDEVPVLLKNRWFTEPAEVVLQGYSLPGKGELDPTGIMSIFYYITFGLMFSDAAYGAIIFFVCLFCYLRFQNMEPNWSKNIRLFMWCGLSTVIWGIVFSSYFGDVVDVVSQHFFGVHYTIPPLWFAPMEKPMLLLVFSFGIGVVHLTAGYIMKGVTCFRQKDYAGVVYDMLFPIAAWYPLMAILLGSDLFAGLAGFKIALPQIATTVCLCISGLSILGIVLTGGRESKNWFKRILKGLYALYNVLSGWLSDVLSYSRLLALGLATGVIASVMNQLGAMTGTGFVGAIGFAVVFLLGQGLNFGINVLGAYVHSNRLAYVEFFGKFYDGGGRKFAPFATNTKYIKIQEEM